MYDKHGEAYWPAVAVNYTAKTQFLFRINKGIESITDNVKINEYVEDDLRLIPFRNMIYFGDGETDIPCMNLVKDKGGHSIAVYDKQDYNKKKVINKLIEDKRVNFVCEADYSQNKEMHQIVMTILNKIKADNDFKLLLDKHTEKSFH